MKLVAIVLIIALLVVVGAYLMVEHHSEQRQRVYQGRLRATVESKSSCQMADIGEGQHEYVCQLNVVYQVAGDTYRTQVLYRGPRTYNVGQTIELEVNPDDHLDVRPIQPQEHVARPR